jgi:hypothetical protein
VMTTPARWHPLPNNGSGRDAIAYSIARHDRDGQFGTVGAADVAVPTGVVLVARKVIGQRLKEIEQFVGGQVGPRLRQELIVASAR